MKPGITPLRIVTTVASGAIIVVVISAAVVALSHGGEHLSTVTEADDVTKMKLPPLFPEIMLTHSVAGVHTRPSPSTTPLATQPHVNPVQRTESTASTHTSPTPSTASMETMDTEPETEPVLLPQKPMTRFPVVCVFGTATNESQPLPADGVCDFTFYDGMYGAGPFDTLYSPRFSAPVEHVLSHASLHTATEYGLSFAYRKRAQVAQDIAMPSGLSMIEELWDRRIRHYGFLSIENYDADAFRESIRTMTQMQRHRDGKASYLAIGLFIERTEIKGALDTMRQIYTPDLIIAHGHVAYDDRKFGADCKMIFPTPFSADGRYRESQLSALAMLEDINYSTSALAVSVALFARRYKPAFPDPDTSSDVTGYSPGMQCTSYKGKHLISLTQFCTDRMYVRGHHPDVLYAGRATSSKKRQRTILYDNEFTLAEKLCLSKERHMGLSYGVAVYGLEYADHSHACPNLLTRAYARTRLAKALVRYFESRPSIDDVENNCTYIRPE
ncbi:hypothetical protein HPB50_011419 [Hyalomma asiaticum]|uniref:Uncharacterized protein n=1 Tax=Hyalomma asiaticum TaxID=266040 RepID=A0ACB7T6W5_HYAAI|nr:hypothetical protein HPB50_011419 [Hyalomma asiaticum]